MAKKIHQQKNETVWEWEETPETIEAIKQLHETVKKSNERRKDSN